jgi:hypothetical protein
MDRREFSRRTLLQGGGAALAGLATAGRPDDRRGGDSGKRGDDDSGKRGRG